ncbi:GNAT family N-acetyltransferase [Actinomadura kijaniata]|uniref:GNAT family N-acetyltransferase n=1 Tax=Actinomadura kijaniata TaxID=46161 RepID=UPI00160050F9|nr:GNAT family N-acetyltransferase [Actinomadura namibiensis]
MLIRNATADDWPAIWPFFHQIVAAGETFPYPLDLDEEQGRAMWLVPDPGRAVVATDGTGTVLGTANMYANRSGNGSHIASASYMVDPLHQGRGVGRALCADSLAWARAAGFRAMVFNAVVETNLHAVRLYESLGFTVLGTVPDGFRHPEKGYVGLHMMHRPL